VLKLVELQCTQSYSKNTKADVFYETWWCNCVIGVKIYADMKLFVLCKGYV